MLILKKMSIPKIRPAVILMSCDLNEISETGFTKRLYFFETYKALPKITINFPGIYLVKIDKPFDIILSSKFIFTILSCSNIIFQFKHMIKNPANNKRKETNKYRYE